MDITIILAVVIFILLIYIAYTDIQTKKERRDLLNRIMAKDFQEYAETQEGDTPAPKGRNKTSKSIEQQINSQFYKN